MVLSKKKGSKENQKSKHYNASPIPKPFPPLLSSVSKGLSKGLGAEMLSFLVFPLPLIRELGSCIALLILLALVFLEWPLVFVLDALTPSVTPLAPVPLRGILEEVPLEVATEPPKKLFDASVGDTGEVSGVLNPVLELAIVPPTPILLVGESTFPGGGVYFPISELGEGATVAIGLITAGLCGEGMPIMNGILLPEPLLSLRWGDEAPTRAPVLDPSDPARGLRRRGAGMADKEPEVPGRESWLFDKPRRSVVEDSDNFRAK